MEDDVPYRRKNRKLRREIKRYEKKEDMGACVDWPNRKNLDPPGKIR